MMNNKRISKKRFAGYFNPMLALQQLCGRTNPIKVLNMMLGANSFVKSDNSVSFKFKMCRKANALRIEYNEDSDLYNMVFMRGFSEVKRFDEIFFDDMKEIFEQFTGLYLDVPRIVGI